MAGLKTTITLQDRMSGVLRNISKTTTTTINSLKAAGVAGDNAFSPDRPNRMKTAIERMKNSIPDATSKMRIFNSEMEKGSNIAGGLAGKVKSLVAAYAGMRMVKGLVELSDQMAQNYARVNLMNDGLQSTSELIESIRAAANRSRGSFQDMTDVVAKLGNNAKGAFKSSKEIVKFAELVQKQFKISGASATEASNAMLQLTQALGSGTLRGDELRSVMEQAPMLIDSIAKSLGVTKGEIRKLAEEGKLTADVVKKAVMDSADDINKKFAEIPMTWQDVWTRVENDSIKALEPVLGVINRLANNQSVVKMMQGISDALGYVAVASGWVIEKIGAIYEYVVNNWNWIGPIVYGIVGALIAYEGVAKAAAVATTLVALAGSGLLIPVAIVGALIAGFVLLCRH